MSNLNPNTICNLFTLEQIEEKITFYMDQLSGSTVSEYDKDTSQGRQKVKSADIDKIESILQAWLKAKECKMGLGKTRIVSADYGNRNLNGII